VFTSTRSASSSIHTGIECGVPSGMTADRCANVRLPRRSWYASGIELTRSGTAAAHNGFRGVPTGRPGAREQ
jgi:hypothetical protein